MRRKGILSWSFNMSLGFIPVIISILLCEWLTEGIAVCVGISMALLYSFYYIRNKEKSIRNIILYLSTAILILVGGAALLFSQSIPTR